MGSGRSDVAETIFGVTPATSGQIQIDGNEMKMANPRLAMDAGMAFLTEDRKATALSCSWTSPRTCSRDPASRPLPPVSSRSAKSRRCAWNRSAKLRVRTPDLEEPVINLSGGNQQKVLIARWLMTQPKILILDEPTRGIDIRAKAESIGSSRNWRSRASRSS